MGEGAQSIVGFDFRAALEMDMEEYIDEARRTTRQIKFTLVDSAMFATFDGEWRVQPLTTTDAERPDALFVQEQAHLHCQHYAQGPGAHTSDRVAHQGGRALQLDRGEGGCRGRAPGTSSRIK